MDEKQSREKYEALFGALSDEDWSELAEGVTDWDAFAAEKCVEGEPEAEEAEVVVEETVTEDEETPEQIIARLTADLESKDAQVAEAVSARETAETALAATQATARAAQVRAEIAATQFGAGLPTNAAVDVLVPLALEPNEVNATAVLDFLKENGGMLPTYIPGESAGLTATNAEGNDGETWLEAKLISDKGKARTREIAATNGGDYRAAYKAYCLEVNAGN